MGTFHMTMQGATVFSWARWHGTEMRHGACLSVVLLSVLMMISAHETNEVGTITINLEESDEIGQCQQLRDNRVCYVFLKVEHPPHDVEEWPFPATYWHIDWPEGDETPDSKTVGSEENIYVGHNYAVTLCIMSPSDRYVGLNDCCNTVMVEAQKETTVNIAVEDCTV